METSSCAPRFVDIGLRTSESTINTVSLRNRCDRIAAGRPAASILGAAPPPFLIWSNPEPTPGLSPIGQVLAATPPPCRASEGSLTGGTNLPWDLRSISNRIKGLHLPVRSLKIELGSLESARYAIQFVSAWSPIGRSTRWPGAPRPRPVALAH